MIQSLIEEKFGVGASIACLKSNPLNQTQKQTHKQQTTDNKQTTNKDTLNGCTHPSKPPKLRLMLRISIGKVLGSLQH